MAFGSAGLTSLSAVPAKDIDYLAPASRIFRRPHVFHAACGKSAPNRHHYFFSSLARVHRVIFTLLRGTSQVRDRCKPGLARIVSDRISHRE